MVVCVMPLNEKETIEVQILPGIEVRNVKML